MLERSQKHRSLADPPDHRTAVNSSSSPLPPPPPPPASSSSSSSVNVPGNAGNVDRVLFRNLVEMVPLVESLMDRRANSSFTRRASMIYTPTPAHTQKALDPRGRKASQTVSAKKRRDVGENASNKHDNGDGVVDDLSIFTSRPLTAENIQKEKEELSALQQQVGDLHKKLLEKDEALKSTEESMNSMRAVYATVDELRRQVVEKDSLIKSVNSELSNAKIKLADRQAALEKLDWEAKTSSRKVEELQGDLDSMDFEVTALMHAFEELSKCDSAAYPDENIAYCHQFDYLPHIDSIDEAEMERMEEVRMAYLTAVAAVKENPSDEFIAAAAEARLRLQAFVF